MRRSFAIALGALALGLSIASFITFLTLLTPSNELILQILLLGVCPLLSLWSFFAASSSHKVHFWPPLLGSLGIVAACGAHVLWSSAIDSAASIDPAWSILIALAGCLFSIAVMMLPWRVLFPDVQRVPFVCLRGFLSILVGAASVVLLALPGTALLCSSGALAVAVLRRNRPTVNDQAAPTRH